MSSLLAQFQEHWAKNFSHVLPINKKLLLAISGGKDSVVLAHLLHLSGIDFAMAHCNFQLRGEDSFADALFVEKLAQQYNIPLWTTTFDTVKIAQQQKKGIEEVARQLRYDWFATLLQKEETLALLATAHHANDTIETLIFNFFRGTGIKGLQGIPLRNNAIIRPLLFASKEAIDAFATAHQLAWQEDYTNQQEHFTRNAIRLQLIPLLEKIFPSIKKTLLQNIEKFKETAYIYEQTISLYKKKYVDKRKDGDYFSILKWQKMPARKTLLWECLKSYHFSSAQIEEVDKLWNAENSAYVSSSTHRIFKNRKHLILVPLQETKSRQILIEHLPTAINFGLGKLKFTQKQNNGIINKDAHIAVLDADTITFPILLRTVKEGDYFYPLGMPKKKKIAKFCKDEKMSMLEKENLWVLEMDKKIIWLIGKRIDNRFKVSSQTKNILQITLL